MSEIVSKNGNLEKFRSDTAKIVEEQGKEGFKKEIAKLEALLDYSFDSRYNPALEKAMENMEIEKVTTTTQISLDNFSNKEETSNLINNIALLLTFTGTLYELLFLKKILSFYIFFE
jgi:hypothetical protein